MRPMSMLDPHHQVVVAESLGMKIARHRGMKRAAVAVARRMAVIMHRMWADGTEFRWDKHHRCSRLSGPRRN